MSPFSSLTLLRRVSIIPAVNSTSRRARGFTLIELLVVISVLGITPRFLRPDNRQPDNHQRAPRRDPAGNADAPRRDRRQPEITMGGEMVATGFKNDIGRLPRHLIELATNDPFSGIYASIVYVGKEESAGLGPVPQEGMERSLCPRRRRTGLYRFDAWDHEYHYYIVNNETLGLSRARGADSCSWASWAPATATTSR